MYICPCIAYNKNTFTTEALPMKNIVLIGMPGTGKSTVGKALAERFGYDFVDADDLIVQTTGKTLPEILRQDGLEAFYKIENKVGTDLIGPTPSLPPAAVWCSTRRLWLI